MLYYVPYLEFEPHLSPLHLFTLQKEGGKNYRC